MARGKKTCPGCGKDLGLRTLTCPSCGHEFRKKEKKPAKEKPEKKIEEPKEEPKKEPVTEVEEEILPKPRKTKKIAYKKDPFHAESVCKCMSPIKYTRHGSIIILIGPVIVSHDLEPELVFNSMYPKIEIDAIEGSLKVFKGFKEQERPDIIYQGMVIIEDLITVK